MKTIPLLSVDDGVVCIAFRSDRFQEIVSVLQQSGLSPADLHSMMENHLNGIVDGLKYLINDKPF